MKSTRRALGLLAGAFLISLMSMACFYMHTTHDIHITLDIRQVQQTATSIEDVVNGDKKLEDLKPKTGSMLLSRTATYLARILDPVSSACAQDTAIKQMTPELENAIQGRRERAARIREYKSAGAVGENKLALVETRDSDLLTKKPDEIRAAVKDENKDRMTIYREIARQNNENTIEGLESVQLAWAEVNRAKSKPGDWIQAPTDAKYLRTFLRGPIGQKLEEKPEPGAWLRVPKDYNPASE